MRIHRCARVLIHALVVGFLVTLVAQSGVLAWYMYRDPPAMVGSRYTSYFLRSSSDGLVVQVSTGRSWGAIEAVVTTHDETSPALPAGLDKYWKENDAALPGVLRRMALERATGVSVPVLLRAWGWPWPCFRASCVYRGGWESSRGVVIKEAGSGNANPSWREFIPTAVWVPGLLANFAALGLPSALVYAVPRVRRALSTVPRCARCGYSLVGLPALSPCPECASLRR